MKKIVEELREKYVYQVFGDPKRWYDKCLSPIDLEEVNGVIHVLYPDALIAGYSVRELEVDLNHDLGGGISGAFIASTENNICALSILIDSKSLEINGRINKCSQRLIFLKELLHCAYFKNNFLCSGDIKSVDTKKVSLNIQDLREKDSILTRLKDINSIHLSKDLRLEYAGLCGAAALMAPYPVRQYFREQHHCGDDPTIWHDFLAKRFLVPKSIIETISSEDYLKKEFYNFNIYNNSPYSDSLFQSKSVPMLKDHFEHFKQCVEQDIKYLPAIA